MGTRLFQRRHPLRLQSTPRLNLHSGEVLDAWGGAVSFSFGLLEPPASSVRLAAMKRERAKAKGAGASPVSDEQIVAWLAEAAGMLPGEAALLDYAAYVQIGRFDLAWEELRTVAEKFPMGFGFFTIMSKAADAIEQR
jgi:hypothetical protein